jgi:CO dehydrogenase maturation factor
LIRALVTDLVLHKEEALVMDCEAGVEHLGRATARGVDAMLVVVEPRRGSLDCATRIFRMAEEIGVENLQVIANKVASPGDEEFVRRGLPGRPIIACIPFSDSIRRAERRSPGPGGALRPGVGAARCRPRGARGGRR